MEDNIKEYMSNIGRLGGQARARKLSASRRSEIARNAVLIMHQNNGHTCKQVDLLSRQVKEKKLSSKEFKDRLRTLTSV